MEETNKENFTTELTSQYDTHKKALEMNKKMLNDNSDNKDACEIAMSGFLRDTEVNPFYIHDNGYIEMNELYIPSQIHSWKVLHQSYVYRLNDYGEDKLGEGENCGIDFSNKKVKLPPKALGKAMLGRNYNFRELAIMYQCRLVKKGV